MDAQLLPPAGETNVAATRDGRELAYVAYGEPGAPVVIHNHGGPSSRLEGRLLAAGAMANGLRLVSVDRPGFGRSTAQPGRTYRGWAEDLTDLADALGAERFGVTGWSEGGPSALAAAAYIDPARLVHVTSIAGGDYGTFGENWAMSRMDAADALGGKLALHHPLAFHLMYEVLALDATHFRRSYMKTVLKAVDDSDRAVLGRPGYADAFADASAECFAQGVDGLIADSLLLYRAWDFDVTAIERPVHIWQGSEDRLVTPAINREVAGRMPAAVWHGVEGGGHFIAVSEAERIFEIAARELAG